MATARKADTHLLDWAVSSLLRTPSALGKRPRDLRPSSPSPPGPSLPRPSCPAEDAGTAGDAGTAQGASSWAGRRRRRRAGCGRRDSSSGRVALSRRSVGLGPPASSSARRGVTVWWRGSSGFSVRGFPGCRVVALSGLGSSATEGTVRRPPRTLPPPKTVGVTVKLPLDPRPAPVAPGGRWHRTLSSRDPRCTNE